VRYKVNSPWGGQRKVGDFYVQSADALDKKTGHVYEDGAYRVVDAANGMKPIKGKGGTTPYFGETAWNDADRKAYDLWFARQRES